MPDAKLTDLPVVTAPQSNDKFYIVNSNLSKSTTLSAIAQNLPSILTTGNANISGNVVLSPTSEILINGADYSNYVYNEISTSFTPNTGNGITLLQSTTDFTAGSGESGLYALSADTVDRLYIKIPNESDYEGRQISLIQLGTAYLEISAADGLTVGSLNNSLSSAGQFSKIDITYIGNQIYTVTGDLSATS